MVLGLCRGPTNRLDIIRGIYSEYENHIWKFTIRSDHLELRYGTYSQKC